MFQRLGKYSKLGVELAIAEDVVGVEGRSVGADRVSEDRVGAEGPELALLGMLGSSYIDTEVVGVCSARESGLVLRIRMDAWDILGFLFGLNPLTQEDFGHTGERNRHVYRRAQP